MKLRSSSPIFAAATLVVVLIVANAEGAINPNKFLRVRRLWGIEEPASVCFSCCAAIFLVVCWSWLHLSGHRHPREWALWDFSRTTELGDYLAASACSSLLAMLTVLRVFDRFFSSHRRARAVLVLCVAILDLRYIWYQVRFDPAKVRLDYGWGIIYNGVFVAIHAPLFISWNCVRLFRHREKRGLLGALCVVVMMVGAWFEVHEFLPWRRIFDAHSMWHFAGAVWAAMFGSWLVCDFMAFVGASAPALHKD
ncbi:hypothetical protein Pelo_8956 [Pelomyxa schiedti]|nr:hypothetical protein Pelo_8956 [Pelomyxa schiedti]